jgi:hypothetical protein
MFASAQESEQHVVAQDEVVLLFLFYGYGLQYSNASRFRTNEGGAVPLTSYPHPMILRTNRQYIWIAQQGR